MSRHINWSDVQVAGTAITEVTDVQLRMQNNTIRGKGDIALYFTSVAVVGLHWVMQVTTEDVAAVSGLTPGAEGDSTATHKKEGNTGAQATGDVTYTLTGSKITDIQTGGAHAQYGRATITVEAPSTDGATSPLGVSIGV